MHSMLAVAIAPIPITPCRLAPSRKELKHLDCLYPIVVTCNAKEVIESDL